MKLIDTHAHLDFKDFDLDREQIIDELARQEIGVIDVATNLDSIDLVNNLSQNNEHIWGAIGLHPTDITAAIYPELPNLVGAWQKIIKNNAKIVAIGEVGLDYFHNRTDHSASFQKAALRQFLVLAEIMKLPVIFHCREAYGDLLVMLEDYKVEGVIHCFNGSQKQAEAFLELGLYLSTTAIITYPKNQPLRDIFAKLPADKILLETDCPFLPPQSRRGQRNDPKSVIELSHFLAELRHETPEKIQEQTTANAKKLFKLP